MAFFLKIRLTNIEVKMEYQIGDQIEMKKQHPCGSKKWEITRVGVDFKFKCLRL